jgi:hypothetical protein
MPWQLACILVSRLWQCLGPELGRQCRSLFSKLCVISAAALLGSAKGSEGLTATADVAYRVH